MVLFFAVTLFFSATLLFWVEPLFAKIVLPMLGGTPAVWNTCMVFYQIALLAGYVYAHLSTKWLGTRRQSIVHGGLLLLSLLTLPVGIPAGLTPPTATNPTPWLFMVLFASIGFPFFMVSATAPLLQKWFSHTGQPGSGDPYFLYGASNLGSLAVLLSYPVLIEPNLRLSEQTWVWTFGYGLLVLLIIGCGVILWRARSIGTGPLIHCSEDSAFKSPPPVGRQSPASDGDTFLSQGEACVSRDLTKRKEGGSSDPGPTLVQRMRWLLLSFCPSSLLLGVTSYITTDIAAVPLLWIIPLSIYLLTFVLVFARKPILPHRVMVWLQPFLILPLCMFLGRSGTGWVLLPLHLLAFFVTAMVCHGELAQSRPSTAHLTEFYLYMSIGGVLGGLFNAMVAPTVFDRIAEYPLALILACLLRPNLPAGQLRRYSSYLDIGLPLVMTVLIVGATAGYQAILSLDHPAFRKGILIIPGMAAIFCYSFRFRPVRFGLGIATIIFTSVLLTDKESTILHKERNFFGILQVRRERGAGQEEFHKLVHGTTVHGAQSLDPAYRREPLTYYHRNGPIGQVFTAVSARNPGQHVTVIGLGTGTMAYYAGPGQRWTFYEIDPAVERIARDPRYFTFLQDSPAKVEVILGDARLSLAKAPNLRYDLMVFDAFSSDAIPMHLITREAINLYLAKLADSGILAFHISNRFLDLKPVLGNLAKDAGLVSLAQDTPVSEAESKALKTRSIWVVMARRQADLEKLVQDYGWKPITASPGAGIWTDDFSNILGVLSWNPHAAKDGEVKAGQVRP